jgi:hypothetical protein
MGWQHLEKLVMICLFKEGILAGLQFEMGEPPYRITADWMKPNPVSYAKSTDMNPSSFELTFDRGSDCYKRTDVHLRADPLEEQHIIVYEVERSW